MTFTDDFSSGSLAGYTGVTDIVATPTGGPGGGTGIIAAGTASQQYYAELEKVFAAATRVGRAKFTFDCAAAGFSTAGNYNIDVRTGTAGSSILYCTQSATDPYTLDVYNTAPAGGSATPAMSFPGVLTGGVFTTVELRFWLSSETLGALDLNGVWQVYINGAYKGGQSGVKVGVVGSGWGAVGFSPMGAGSDVFISDVLPNLLTNVALVGAPNTDTAVAAWQLDGTVNGVITLPETTFDLGAVALSIVDNRIYVIVTDPSSGCDFLVYSETGTLLATIALEELASPVYSYSVSVPQAGLVWVAIEGPVSGQIRSYDVNGGSQTHVATLTASGVVYIQAAYGMVKLGGGLFFMALTSGGTDDGVYRYNLSGGGDCVQIIAGHVNGLAATPAGDLIVTGRLANDSVERFSPEGTLLQTYPISGGAYVIGVAADPAGGFAWVGDEVNDVIVRLDLDSGSQTTFSSLIGTALCDSALAAGLPVVPPGSLYTLLPGPLTADTSFMVMPEGASPYPYGAGNPTLVVAGLATTIASPLNTIAINAIIDATSDPTVAICGRKEGGWWQALDNAGSLTDFVDAGLPGPTHLLNSDVLACNGPIGDLKARRDLLELPSADLVSIVRSTGVLTRFARANGAAVQSYNLTITSALGFDGAVNSPGNRLLYLNVEDVNIGPTQIKAYALDTDTDLGGLFHIDGVAWSFVWLPDCTFLMVVRVGDVVNIQRYNLQGKLVRTYVVPDAALGEGIYGIAASKAVDRLWAVTDWDGGQSNEQFAVSRFKLSTGELLGPSIPLLGELTDYDGLSCIGQPWYENKCVPVAPPPSSVKQWALERFDLTDRQEQTS